VTVLVRIDATLGEQQFADVLATVLGGDDERRRALDVLLVEQNLAALLENQLDKIGRCKLGCLVQCRRPLAGRTVNGDVGAVLDHPARKLLVDVALEHAERQRRAQLLVAVVQLRALLLQIGEHRRMFDVAKRGVVEDQRIVLQRHAQLLDKVAHNMKVRSLRRQSKTVVSTCTQHKTAQHQSSDNRRRKQCGVNERTHDIELCVWLANSRATTPNTFVRTERTTQKTTKRQLRITDDAILYRSVSLLDCRQL
jgi:hypothetical protein